MQEALDGETVQVKYSVLRQNGMEIFCHARLRFEKDLATGGFGCIFFGEVSGKKCALKVVDTYNMYQQVTEVSPERLADYILSEVEMMSKFKQRFFCELFGFCKEKEFVLVMELCDGNFSRLILERNPSQREVLGFIAELLEAICVMHSNGVAHRDLKPENLLLVNN